MYWDQPALMGLDHHPAICILRSSPTSAPLEKLNDHGREMGTVNKAGHGLGHPTDPFPLLGLGFRQHPNTCCCQWDSFPTVCLSPGPSLPLGNSFSGFLFTLMLSNAETSLQRFLSSLK